MMNELLMKIDLLCDTGIIDQKDKDVLTMWINYCDEHMTLDTEKFDVFVTHCAMILSRTRENSLINKLDESIFESIDQQLLQKAIQVMKEMKEIQDFNECEDGYVLVHLCNLLSK